MRRRRKRKPARRTGPRDLVWEKQADGRWSQVPRCESARYRDEQVIAIEQEVAGANDPAAMLQLADRASRAAERGDTRLLRALVAKVTRDDLDPSDVCEGCGVVLAAEDLKEWRWEFGIEADERPHMQDTPRLCADCADKNRTAWEEAMTVWGDSQVKTA